MAKLSDSLRPASFRGVPFFVEEASRTAGRRTQVHEYPQRDDPYVEDLGRATREFNVTAFVVGTDYIDTSGKLLDACEAPGAGKLVHPWLGELDVILKEPARASYSKALGQVTIEMPFVESGKYVFIAQQTKPATAAQSAIAADTLKSAEASRFEKMFSVSNMPDFVSQAAMGDINNIFAVVAMPQIPGLAVLQFANTALASAQSSLLLINNPAALRDNLIASFGLTDIVGQLTTGADLINCVVALTQHPSMATPVVPPNCTPAQTPITTTNTTADSAIQQQYANTYELHSLIRLTLLAEAVGLSSTVPATVHDDTVALRDNLMAQLDIEASATTDADIYDALVNARVKVWEDLTERSKNSARVTTITPAESMPMLAVAYDYYGDATRDVEIIARNKVRHPLFVAAKPLKVVQA